MSIPHKSHSAGFLAIWSTTPNRASRKSTSMNIGKCRPRAHLLIDVREDNEWAAGHAAGAIHLGKGIIERDIESKVPDKSATMVLYCGGGFRSALAADALQKMGYQNAISLDGGWRAWNAAGLPVEK